MSVSAWGSIRVPRVGSTSWTLVEHRWFIGAMKWACFPLELAEPLLRKPYTRDAYAPLLCRSTNRACAVHTPVRRQNLLSKSYSGAPPRRFNSRSPLNQRLFCTAVLPRQMRGTLLYRVSRRLRTCQRRHHRFTIRFKFVPIRPPFQGDSLCTWFPGLKAWAILSSPFGRLEHPRENVETRGGLASNAPVPLA